MEEECREVFSKALSLLRRKSYSSRSLYRKLLQKYDFIRSKNVVDFCLREGIINDEVLCKDTVSVLVLKKAYSKQRIIQKLNYYGFQKDHIHDSMCYVEVLYRKGEIEMTSIAGGILCKVLEGYAGHCFFSLEKNIWNVLALCAYVEIIVCNNSEIQKEKIINRLQLRGFDMFSIHRALYLMKYISGDFLV